MAEPCADPMGWGGFWEKWVESCDESYRRPLTEQYRAMFPHLCIHWLEGHCCFQLEEPEWDLWNWLPFWPGYCCDPPHRRAIRERFEHQ